MVFHSFDTFWYPWSSESGTFQSAILMWLNMVEIQAQVRRSLLLCLVSWQPMRRPRNCRQYYTLKDMTKDYFLLRSAFRLRSCTSTVLLLIWDQVAREKYRHRLFILMTKLKSDLCFPYWLDFNGCNIDKSGLFNDSDPICWMWWETHRFWFTTSCCLLHTF